MDWPPNDRFGAVDWFGTDRHQCRAASLVAVLFFRSLHPVLDLLLHHNQLATVCAGVGDPFVLGSDHYGSSVSLQSST